jgi:MFS family permease
VNFFRVHYPSQIWLLFWGALTGSIGQSLVWPFLVIAIRERTGVPLTQITLLFTLQSAAGFAATALLGPLMDRFGRKWAMLGGLFTSGVVLLTMSQAQTLAQWAILLPAYGMVNMMFRIGSYAMVADLVEPEQRTHVYALLRMGDNLGIVIGPSLGGFLASIAYSLSYVIAGATQFVLLVFVSLNVHETLPQHDSASNEPNGSHAGGYGRLAHDRAFLGVWGCYILVNIASSMVFVLLGLYTKENFGIDEDRYGLIVGANAVMVVLFQFAITRRVAPYAPLPVMAVGALFYAAGLTVYALSQGFAGFLLGMVVMTCGELLLVPTTTAFVANLAPPEMRARYMGAFSLSFRIGAGIGPVVGGLLSDQIAPVATWYGGLVSCLIGAAGFIFLARPWGTTAPAIRAAAESPSTTR